MSTKTTFKRIALVAVAALGFGVLSVVPSQAAVSGLIVTATNGTATTLNSDSRTAAVLDISFLALAGKEDSVTVSIVPAAAFPTGSASIMDHTGIFWTESSTSLGGASFPLIDTAAVGVVVAGAITRQATIFNDNSFRVKAPVTATPADADNGTYGVKVKFSLGETSTASTIVAGTYSFNAIVGSNSGAAGARVTTIVPFNIVVSATAAELATASTVIDPSKTVATLVAGASGITDTAVNLPDSAVSVLATASTTAAASFVVRSFNAQSQPKPESLTVTITGAGSLRLGSNGIVGSNFTNLAASAQLIEVIPNGVAGVGSIVISTPTKTFAPKLVTFYAAAPATIVPSVDIPVIGIGTDSDVIALDAKDANGNIWAGTAYLISTDTAVATGSTCAYNATDKVHYCAVTGVAAGQSKFRVGNASTLALSTVAIAEFNGPRVSIQTPASVKIEFDKATYNPGEKAKVYITVLDAAGNTIPADTYTNVFATGGIAVSLAFGAGGDNAAETLTATSITTDASNSTTTLTRAGSEMYSFTMGAASGTVELTAKGGTSLPLAAQVAVTASADIVNSAEDAANEALDAAIAATDAAILAEEAAANAEAAATAAAETAEAALDAVTALSAQVTKLVAQLASLQKLVNKIAKRVGAKK